MQKREEKKRETSSRGQQSRASGNDKQKSLSPQGPAICIDTISIQYRYNIDMIQYPPKEYSKIPKNTQKYPKVP